MARTEQLEPLAERLIAAMPRLDPQAQQIGLAPIRQLAEGRPLFLPGLLGRAARVSSRCPVTGEAISPTVTSDGPSRLRPTSTVLSFLAPVRPFDADVVRSFCHFVHFSASARAADEWITQHPGTFALSVEDGFELGRLTNAAIFGAALHGAGIAP